MCKAQSATLEVVLSGILSKCTSVESYGPCRLVCTSYYSEL